MRLIASLIVCACIVRAQDGPALLAKAGSAFAENSARERYWIWTTTTTRSILDKNGKVIEELPSVMIDSPIRGDGKRCNAVLAWGDGVTPYLINASAEERCKVEQESTPALKIDVLLAKARAAIVSRSDSQITLAIHADKSGKHGGEAADLAERCASAIEGTIELDSATDFPKRIELRVVTNGCVGQPADYEEHYDGSPVRARGGYPKGAEILIEYELQRDKSGNASRDYWIAAHRRVSQPFQKSVSGLMISGRLFKLASKGSDRRGIVESVVKAREVTADVVVKFETGKEK